MRFTLNPGTIVRSVLLLSVVCFLLVPIPAIAQPVPTDVVTVGSGSGVSGSTIDVPVSIRDISQTPLGIDQPPGSKIQAFSLKVNYSPAADVQSVTFTRGGITTTLTPADEIHSSSTGSVSLLDSFDEMTNPIPFTLNGAAPGNQVAHLTFHLAPGLPAGTQITLTLDPILTQLTDQGGDAATIESVGNGRLSLVAGAITVLSPVPALSAAGLALLVLLLGIVGVRFASRSI